MLSLYRLQKFFSKMRCRRMYVLDGYAARLLAACSGRSFFQNSVEIVPSQSYCYFAGATQAAARPRGANNGGLWRFYTEDSTGLKIGPVPVLVMSLVFIASVFVLHIWGKFTRSRV